MNIEFLFSEFELRIIELFRKIKFYTQYALTKVNAVNTTQINKIEYKNYTRNEFIRNNRFSQKMAIY